MRPLSTFPWPLVIRKRALLHKSVPMQLAQCWFPEGWPFPVLKLKYSFQIKYTKTILSNSTRKLLWFEINKMLIDCS